MKQSGIFEVVHDAEHRAAHEVVMIAGDAFPNCETCDQKVRFRLVRTAPYIFQDQDFEEEKVVPQSRCADSSAACGSFLSSYNLLFTSWIEAD